MRTSALLIIDFSFIIYSWICVLLYINYYLSSPEESLIIIHNWKQDELFNYGFRNGLRAFCKDQNLYIPRYFN